MAGRTLALCCGPSWHPVSWTEVPRSWPDWRLTSSGIGHNIIPPVSFPPPTVKVTRSRLLGQGDWGLRCSRLKKEGLVHSRGAPTTGRKTGSTHLGFRRGHQQVGNHLRIGSSTQDPWRPLRAAQSRGAQGPHEDCRDQGFRGEGKILSRPSGLTHSAWRLPLSSKHHISETKEQYSGWPGLDPRVTFDWGTESLELANHNHRGPSQALVPWTRNLELAGQPFTVSDQGVLDRSQLYLTTTARDFRAYPNYFFPYMQKSPVPPVPGSILPKMPQINDGLQKNILKVQLLYSAHPLLPQEGVVRIPPQRFADLLELRGDASGLGPRPTAAALSALLSTTPAAAGPVPHNGALTLAQESYSPPLHPLRSRDRFCPLEAPWGGPHWKSVPAIYTVPHAYRTESLRYGSRKAALV
ncbi:PREDICTED: uncharacterized protein LOC102831380 [Chrysochloris asiatica]|uniref:Uncharacterized protein LOC102831380 n=1 Tax=Chrysochloris asiatica TaxID=185453 RepID=A0A9B0TQI6_CHRAS|nr:PREDICTED: uncharacterized protein LOC102831380 [Chrysochloris asiatica]